MANYQAIVDAYLTDYRPQLRAELMHTGELEMYIAQTAEAMQAAKARLKAQLLAETPALSALQADLEAERTVLAQFLPL